MGLEELTDHLQDSFAGALERRLGAEAEEELSPDNEATNPDADAKQLHMGDLESLMTPKQVTPVVSPKGASKKLTGDCIGAQAQQVLDDKRRKTQERNRLSMSIQHRP